MFVVFRFAERVFLIKFESWKNFLINRGRNKMVKMRVVDAVMYVLEKEGIIIVFGVSGVVINSFYLAMRKYGGIRYILARYVEGVSYMAEGYIRVTVGNIGVCLGIFGFAGTDMIIAFYFVFVDFIFILCIIG